ncbi:MAG TPA: hypothetical protein VFV48_03705 [Pseudomonadales bacterium]|nr:hypothetical protein [Pseudomonadales bacterium]
MPDTHCDDSKKYRSSDLLGMFDHGFEQAQKSLVQLLLGQIFFRTQSARLEDWSAVYKLLLDPHSIAVLQSFNGDYQGVLSLILPKKLWFSKQVPDQKNVLSLDKIRSDISDDVLNEASNIVANSVLRSLSLLMIKRFSSGLPQQPSKNLLARFFSEKGFEASRVFVIRVDVRHIAEANSSPEPQQIVLCLHMKSDFVLDNWYAHLLSIISESAI